MKYLAIFALIFTGAYHTVVAQPQLKPSIGISNLPADTDSICYIPMFTGSFNTSGYLEGDTVADFKLYDLNGDSVILSNVLAQGKPVLLVAGSYTCPVYRNKLFSLNNIVSQYAGQIETMIIYTIEAHPIFDTSVYFGYVNTGAQNYNSGILYQQPRTYGQRKTVATDMLNALSISAPIYIDGVCNEWWSNFGPAPNNAYLIDTNGVVFAKHGWFDKYPDKMDCDIDSLLYGSSTCSLGGAGGIFSFNMLSSDTLYDVGGSTITFNGELVNNSSQDVVIEMYRIINNMPQGWASSMCVDICYSTTTDSAMFLLAANTTEDFHFYVYTNSSIDTARARVGFRNSANSTNQALVNMFAITNGTTGVNEIIPAITNVSLYPVPASSYVNLGFTAVKNSDISVEVFDVLSRKVLNFHAGKFNNGYHQLTLDLNEIDAGTYFVRIIDSENGTIVNRRLIID